MLVHSGGIYYQDNTIEYLFEVFQNLDEKIKLIFLCSEKDQIRIKSFKNYNSLNHKIFLHNLIPYSQLNSVLSIADVGLILNYKPGWPSHWYSLPNRIFDYIHAGLPILSTKQPEFKTIINKYDLGKTFDLMNKRSFIDSLTVLINELEYFKKKTILAKTENNWEIEKSKLIKTYTNVFQ